ncbi:MAG: hypothetical protein P1U40_03300 [Coxiellaceae bacterium]|nr:hypothetical protein [Coxiellaceae bacterium]
MPKWSDRRAITVDNLLKTFSTDTLKKLLYGHLELTVSTDATARIKYMHPCDTEKVDAPRYYAMYAGSMKYVPTDISDRYKTERLMLNQRDLMDLLERSVSSPKALIALHYIITGRDYINYPQRTFYHAIREKFLGHLVENPQPLIALAGSVALADEDQQGQFIAFLFAIKRAMTAEQFAHMMTATHATNSVINALLASKQMCDSLDKAQFFTVIDIAYTHAKTPLTTSYIDKILSFHPSETNLSHVFFGAARCGDIAMVRQLLAVHATTRLVDADYVDPITGESALHCALQSALSDEIVGMVIAQTKNKTRCDHCGYNPLALALKLGRVSIVDTLLLIPAVQKEATARVPLSKTVLHAAVESHDDGMLRKALTIPGIDRIIDCPDLHGDTALSMAVKLGKFDHVQLLMAYGAVTHSSNIEGTSPQDYAKHNRKMLALLQRSPADALALSATTPPAKTEPEGESSDFELIKTQVISILDGQVKSDWEYTVDVPVARLHLFDAISDISQASDLHSVHQLLIKLQQQQFVKNDGKGEPITHSFLRQTTIVHLQYYGFLQHIPISGLSAKLAQARNSMHALFYQKPPTVPIEAPAAPPEPSAPELSEQEKPNDVAAKMKA